jgi:hypothetical protein
MMSMHFFDVRADAPNYPLRLNQKGTYVVDPGLVGSYDKATQWWLVTHVRFSLALFRDCAAQPQGFLGVYAMFPTLRYRSFSFFGGMGGVIAVRRSWERHVDPQHTSAIYHSLGAVDYAVGPFGELDFGVDLAQKMTLVVNTVPGIPYFVFVSAGLRWILD